MESKKTTFTPRHIAGAGILSGISVVLMYVLEFPLPFMPPFLKFDFSTIPVLIGGFVYGPLTGVIIAGVKSLLHIFITDSGGVGQLADFLAASSFTLVSALIYKKNKTKKGAVSGLLFGMLAMVIIAAFVNYFLLIPAYSKVTPLEQIIEICGLVNPLIDSTLDYVLYGAIPFNIIKGIALSVITFVLYKHISKILH